MKLLLPLIISISFISCSKSTPIPPKKIFPSRYMSPSDLEHINFHNKELTTIKLNNTFYYLRKDGKMRETLEFDGKADRFSDGLARTKINGKIGFFNTNLEIELKPIYDFAFPFHNGVAEICMGCKDGGKDALLDGGRWKKISREGVLLEE